jgi:hypothetical protein
MRARPFLVYLAMLVAAVVAVVVVAFVMADVNYPQPPKITVVR